MNTPPAQSPTKTYAFRHVLGAGDGLCLITSDGRFHGYADINGGGREYVDREFERLAPKIRELEAAGYVRGVVP